MDQGLLQPDWAQGELYRGCQLGSRGIVPWVSDISCNQSLACTEQELHRWLLRAGARGCCQGPRGCCQGPRVGRSALAAVGIVYLFAPTTCRATPVRAANRPQAVIRASVASSCFKPPRFTLAHLQRWRKCPVQIRIVRDSQTHTSSQHLTLQPGHHEI